MELALSISSFIGILAIAGFAIRTHGEVNNKVNRAYQRLDEVKEVHDAFFVRKDVCTILHQQLKDDLKEIKDDVKRLLHKNGIQK